MNQPQQYEVHLYKAGDNPQEIAELVRQFTEMNLDEARIFVDDLPRTLLSGVYYEQASKAVISLENVGADVGLTKIYHIFE